MRAPDLIRVLYCWERVQQPRWQVDQVGGTLPRNSVELSLSSQTFRHFLLPWWLVNGAAYIHKCLTTNCKARV
jgi:hypothetical protein